MRAKYGMWRAHLGKPNMVGWGIPELTMQNATQTPSQKLLLHQILVRRPHCNFNVKLEFPDQKDRFGKERS